MSLAVYSLVINHPLWHLACRALTFFNVEDLLSPSLHLGLCGDWSGLGSPFDAPQGKIGNATSHEQPRRLEHHEEEEEEQNGLLIFLLICILLALIEIAVEAVIVHIYQDKVKNHRASTAALLQAATVQAGPYTMRNTNDFQFGICDCMQACETCLHAVFCLQARTADTQNAILGSGFWALWMYWSAGTLIGYVLDGVLFSGSMIWSYEFGNLFVAIYSVSKRQEIRRRFGGDPSGTYFRDFCCWWCCPFCTATQEARTVDGAAKLTMRCCCSLAPQTGVVQMVTEPVAVGVPVGAPVAVGTVVVAPTAKEA